jgi:XTP/dITP diphosphohydrolase
LNHWSAEFIPLPRVPNAQPRIEIAPRFGSNVPVTTLLIATRNTHKVGEIRAILGDAFRYLTLADLAGSPQIVEDAPTFEGNARKKAVQLACWLAANPDSRLTRHASRVLVLADDSGLEVDALDGAPGVHSARFAALDTGAPGNSKDVENNAKLLRLLAEVPGPRRTARFRCVIALTPVPEPHGNASPVCSADEPELQTQIFQGACEGQIGFEPQGGGGFGYDPLFFPVGSERSFAQLPRERKNTISHRAQALAKLKAFFKAQ